VACWRRSMRSVKLLCCSVIARDPPHVGSFGSDRVLRATKRRTHLVKQARRLG
jgi:hypothetical protein